MALIDATDLTKEGYLYITKILKEHHADVFPSYDKVLEAKQRCYPDASSVTVTESEATIALQVRKRRL